jgi:CRP/FNR family cyclic AMP-dependent transcriptional regulator
MQGLERILGEHRLFAGLGESFLALAAGCAKNAVFKAEDYLFRGDDPADWIYLVRHGRVALEMASPGRGAIQFETLGEGEIVGLTWLLPPYHWGYDARATELTRTLALDARCLRDKCEADHDLGYELLKRFLPVLERRLQETWLQMLDVYGRPG